jgi:UDPglucose--hexose-1-phosphate uridylyltransferase
MKRIDKNENDEIWEQRWHPLFNEWVVVASHRQNRPWKQKNKKMQITDLPLHDPKCHLCPGNKRAQGQMNPDYKEVFVFDNDYPGISQNAPKEISKTTGIYKNKPATGVAKVICYTPKHNVTMAELDNDQIKKIIKTWQKETKTLSKLEEINNVVIFENKGELCGASSTHSHGQIFATNFSYKNIDAYVKAAKRYYLQNKKILFQDILFSEKQDNKRIIYENDNAIAFLPFFSKYPYEIYVTIKKTHKNVVHLNSNEISDFAEALRIVLVKLDNIWEISFPYSMMIHQAPTDGLDYSFFHFYLAIYPPYRKNGLVKYLGGIEIGGGNIHSDTSPEKNAALLKKVSTIHYKKRESSKQNI